MSEYQYYEFLTIDRTLTEDEIAALRALSTRATITPMHFANEYHWGDFSGDPDELMRRFFDAHVYVANWMTAIFKVRVPIDTLPRETAEMFSIPYLLDIKATRHYWIITWTLEESENYDRFGMEDGRGWMARLVQVREELLQGDLRSLYIGWLPGVSLDMYDDEKQEPLSMSGLGELTPAQQALADFLEVDQDLLVGAGMDSLAIQEPGMSEQKMDIWIAALPRDQVNKVIKELLEGKRQDAQQSVRSEFMAWRRDQQPEKSVPARRSVGELRKNAVKARKIRYNEEKRAHEQRKMRLQKEREAYLKTLSKDFTKAWNAIREPAQRGSGLGYDQACRAIVDLEEAYSLHAPRKEFQDGLKKFMSDHMHRKALIQRLVKAGVWKI